MKDEPQTACCFCGKSILKTKVDPGELAYAPAFMRSGGNAPQGLYCHARCLEQRLHPSVKLYALDLMEDADG
jgi:hypothetical protein